MPKDSPSVHKGPKGPKGQVVPLRNADVEPRLKAEDRIARMGMTNRMNAGNSLASRPLIPEALATSYHQTAQLRDLDRRNFTPRLESCGRYR